MAADPRGAAAAGAAADLVASAVVAAAAATTTSTTTGISREVSGKGGSLVLGSAQGP